MEWKEKCKIELKYMVFSRGKGETVNKKRGGEEEEGGKRNSPIVVSGPAWRAAARRKSRGPSAFSQLSRDWSPFQGLWGAMEGTVWTTTSHHTTRIARSPTFLPTSLGRISRAIRDSRRVLVSFRGSFVEADGAAIGPHDSLRFEISIFESCRFYEQLFLSLSFFLSFSVSSF